MGRGVAGVSGPRAAGVELAWKRIVALSLLGLLNVAVLYYAILATSSGLPLVGMGITAIVGLFDYVFLAPAAYPYRYLFPAYLCFGLFMLLPLIYSVLVAFTNTGTGHVLNFERARAAILSEVDVGGGAQYGINLYENEKGERLLYLAEDSAAPSFWVAKLGSGWPSGEPVRVAPAAAAAAGSRIQDADGDGTPDVIEGYKLQPKRALVQNREELGKLVLEKPDGALLRLLGTTTFGEQSARYKAVDRFTLREVATGVLYKADLSQGSFVGEDGSRLSPGFTAMVGMRNFQRLLYDPAIVRPFLKIAVWNFLWAAFSVLTTFFVGAVLAGLLNWKELRFRGLWRTLLILPYAVPGFITILIWRGMLNQDFGIINEYLSWLMGLRVPWLEHPLVAKVTAVLVNLWLGFPYMLIISSGVLQSISEEVYESSAIDGAGAFANFRFITLPLLVRALAPLLVASFAFNFNNFIVIYLLTEGRPPMVGAQTVAGETDILLSYTYKLAFQGGLGNDYGLAAAVSLVVFFIVAALSVVNFRVSGVLRDV